MEDRIRRFLKVNSKSSDGLGYSSSYEAGHSDGYGVGYGVGYGFGSDDGTGYGCSAGAGYNDGDGSGYGKGPGHDDGTGSGYGGGSGYGIKKLNGDRVYTIDEIPTIIKTVRGNVAKGYILNSDYTLTPTYVVKDNGKFAHGETLREAFESLQEKLYDGSTEEERIEAFKEHFPDFTKKVPAKELFCWHHVLTGSCKQGRQSFCANKGIDIEKDLFTINEFVELTKDTYGGSIIRKLI